MIELLLGMIALVPVVIWHMLGPYGLAGLALNLVLIWYLFALVLSVRQWRNFGILALWVIALVAVSQALSKLPFLTMGLAFSLGNDGTSALMLLRGPASSTLMASAGLLAGLTAFLHWKARKLADVQSGT